MNKNLMVPEGANAEPKEILHNVEGGGGEVNIPVITVALSQVVKAGQDVGSGHAYITLSTTPDQRTILENQNVSVIKIDLSAVQSTLQLPVAYLWIKKNTINVIQGLTLIQYSFDNSGFEYCHAIEDNYVVLKEIGTGGAIYESTSSKELFISFSSINPTIMWTRIGDCEKVIPEEASESNKLADKAWVSAHAGGGTKLYRHIITPSALPSGIGAAGGIELISIKSEAYTSGKNLMEVLYNDRNKHIVSYVFTGQASAPSERYFMIWNGSGFSAISYTNKSTGLTDWLSYTVTSDTVTPL